jgi:hypothetical protein
MDYVIILSGKIIYFLHCHPATHFHTVQREALTCFSPLPVVFWSYFQVAIMSQPVSQQYACA